MNTRTGETTMTRMEELADRIAQLTRDAGHQGVTFEDCVYAGTWARHGWEETAYVVAALIEDGEVEYRDGRCYSEGMHVG